LIFKQKKKVFFVWGINKWKEIHCTKDENNKQVTKCVDHLESILKVPNPNNQEESSFNSQLI
jgi:hypothetical protein